MRKIEYRFYDKKLQKMYYPKGLQLAKFLECYLSGDYPHLIAMQATGIFDATKFKNLSPEQKNEWLKNHTKEEWHGFEIYEGDVAAISYGKERTEYGVVHYSTFGAGFSKGGTALSSYQKLTTIVGNLYEGFSKEAQFSVDFYYDNRED